VDTAVLAAAMAGTALLLWVVALEVEVEVELLIVHHILQVQVQMVQFD
jgi:hypothetical protein